MASSRRRHVGFTLSTPSLHVLVLALSDSNDAYSFAAL